MDADAFPQELLVEDEPRYLRRQKPVEIRRRKFGKKAWKSYLRITIAVGVTLAFATAVYALGAFLLFFASQMSLLHPEQVRSAAIISFRAEYLEVFSVDRGRSVLRIPLDARRWQIEADAVDSTAPWSVARLPNRCRWKSSSALLSLSCAVKMIWLSLMCTA